MREIKFRAWNKEEKSMSPVQTLPGWLSDALKQGAIYEPKLHDEIGRFFGLLIFMQATGAKDKKDNEIYEGDVVAYKIGSLKLTDIVEWDEGNVRWAKGNQGLSTYQKTTEILGNIYENPELLKNV